MDREKRPREIGETGPLARDHLALELRVIRHNRAVLSQGGDESLRAARDGVRARKLEEAEVLDLAAPSLDVARPLERKSVG